MNVRFPKKIRQISNRSIPSSGYRQRNLTETMDLSGSHVLLCQRPDVREVISLASSGRDHEEDPQREAR